MKEVALDLQAIIDRYSVEFGKMAEETLAHKPGSEKWSKKEVIGHLIDSAQNNLRRFIVCQYEPTPPKIVYEQDFWVNANDYQNRSAKEVITLWRLVNLQIVHVLSGMAVNNYQKPCDTGREEEKLHTLEWLASDYVKHLKHHINQIIPRSFDIVYP